MFPTLLLAFCSQGVPSARPSTEAVNAAIDRGVSHLLDSQLLDGSWEFVHEQSLPGQTAMVLYTLLRCGVPSNAPEVELGLAYLRSHRPQDKITYNRSWMLLALLERGDSQDRPLEEELLQGILAAQEPTGLFRYSKTQYSDLSNTQYAALALRAAASARLKISPKIWIRLAEGVGSCQFRG